MTNNTSVKSFLITCGKNIHLICEQTIDKNQSRIRNQSINKPLKKLNKAVLWALARLPLHKKRNTVLF